VCVATQAELEQVDNDEHDQRDDGEERRIEQDAAHIGDEKLS
jgi:hypothetical protein